jgi:pimeloyl-ACP methyl ester carboxylesterase
MISRFAKTLIGLSILVSAAALALGVYGLISRSSLNSELGAVREDLARVQQSTSDEIAGAVDPLTTRIGDLETRTDALSADVADQAATTGLTASSLGREVDQLRAFLRNEYPGVDLDSTIPGQILTQGRFAILQLGEPIGEDDFQLYESEHSHTLVSSLEEQNLGIRTALKQLYILDGVYSPISFHLTGSEASGPVDLVISADGSVLGAAGVQTPSDTAAAPSRITAVLDPELISTVCIFYRAREALGDDTASSSVVSRTGEPISIRLEKAKPVTLISGDTREMGTRYSCVIGDGQDLDYTVLNDEVVAVEIPDQAIFAYREDLFPDGLMIEARTLEEMGIPYGILELQLPFTSGGLQLSGTLTYPGTGGDVLPIILLLADFGGFNRDGDRPGLQTELLKQTADTLAQQGIATYRFDYRGVGESEGDYSRVSFADLLLDARVALLMLQALPVADPAAIYVMGIGEGAVLASRLVSGANIGGLITFGAPAHTLDAMRLDLVKRRAEAQGLTSEQVDEAVARESDFLQFAVSRQEESWADVPFDDVSAALPWMTPAEFSRRTALYPLPLLRNLCQIDPVEAIRAVTVPARFIQGGNDFEAPPGQAQLLARTLEGVEGSDVAVFALDDVNHWGRGQVEPYTSLNGHLDLGISDWMLRDIYEWLGTMVDLPTGGPGGPASRS